MFVLERALGSRAANIPSSIWELGRYLDPGRCQLRRGGFTFVPSADSALSPAAPQCLLNGGIGGSFCSLCE